MKEYLSNKSYIVVPTYTYGVAIKQCWNNMCTNEIVVDLYIKLFNCNCLSLLLLSIKAIKYKDFTFTYIISPLTSRVLKASCTLVSSFSVWRRVLSSTKSGKYIIQNDTTVVFFSHTFHTDNLNMLSILLCPHTCTINI